MIVGWRDRIVSQLVFLIVVKHDPCTLYIQIRKNRKAALFTQHKLLLVFSSCSIERAERERSCETVS
jgi:hypothetical protein